MAFIRGSIVNGKYIPGGGAETANTGGFVRGSIVNGKYVPGGQATLTETPATSNYIQDSLNQLTQTIFHPVQAIKNTVGAAVNSIIGTVGTAYTATKEAFTGTNETTAKKTADLLHAFGADVSIVFAPINAAFAAAEQLPVLKQAADLISLPFTVTGKIGDFAAEKFVDVLPISQEDKDVLKPAFGEVGALAGQILLGGKVMDLIVKGVKIKKPVIDEVVKDTNTKIEIAKQEAIKAKPIEQIGQVKPETTGGKISGVAKSIEANAIEQGIIKNKLTDLAEYSASTIKEQSRLVSDLINTGIDNVRKIFRDEKPLPKDIKPGNLIIGVEEWMKKDPTNPVNIEIVKEMANSKIASAPSEAGSVLGLMQERSSNSPIARVQEVNKVLAKKASQAKIETDTLINKAKAEMVKKNLPKADLMTKLTKYIDDITC
jgi:hypothetical protein